MVRDWGSPPSGSDPILCDEQMPDDVRWIRSYVLVEEDGSLGIVCIYVATIPRQSAATL